jgi:hypothetical protein
MGWPCGASTIDLLTQFMTPEEISRIKNDLVLYARTGKAEKLVECVNLLRQGVEGFHVDFPYGGSMTAFLDAAGMGRVESLKALLALGADLHQTTRGGQTALMMAASRGSVPAVQFLLEAGADVEVRDRECKKALDHARFADAAEVAALLVGLEAASNDVLETWDGGGLSAGTAKLLRNFLHQAACDGSRGQVLAPGALAEAMPQLEVPAWWEALVTCVPVAGVAFACPSPEGPEGDGAHLIRLDELQEIASDWESYVQPWQNDGVFPIAVTHNGHYWVLPSDGSVDGPVHFWDRSMVEVMPWSPSFAAWLERALAIKGEWRRFQ